MAPRSWVGYQQADGQLSAQFEPRKPPAARWLEWRRRHQARSRWFHKRARLARNYSLVS
jgi:hypothetical protein